MATATSTSTRTRRSLTPGRKAAAAEQALERANLAAFNKRRKILGVRVEAVARKSQNGLAVHGPPGLGKTTTVRKTLDRLKCD